MLILWMGKLRTSIERGVPVPLLVRNLLLTIGLDECIASGTAGRATCGPNLRCTCQATYAVQAIVH